MALTGIDLLFSKSFLLNLNSVDAQWITAQKDWREAKRKDKLRNQSQMDGQDDAHEYEADMDEMRCILYAHGGIAFCFICCQLVIH